MVNIRRQPGPELLVGRVVTEIHDVRVSEIQPGHGDAQALNSRNSPPQPSH